MSTIITPTVGRVVWYHNAAQQGPFSAMIASVHSPRLVTLGGFDVDGTPFSATNVPLVQDGENPPLGSWCEWMPYQKGQAAKTDEFGEAMRRAAPCAPNGESHGGGKRPEVQNLPSRFQIGEDVLLPCQVVAVAFDNGKVRYRVSLTESGDEVSVPSECVAPDKVERVQ